MRITIAMTIVLIHKLVEQAEAKGWTLIKKEGGSIPVSKCPKCGKPTVITFFKNTTDGKEFFDVCAHTKVSKCNMLFHISVQKDKLIVSKYRHTPATAYIAYGSVVAPDGLNVIKYR